MTNNDLITGNVNNFFFNLWLFKMKGNYHESDYLCKWNCICRDLGKCQLERVVTLLGLVHQLFRVFSQVSQSCKMWPFDYRMLRLQEMSKYSDHSKTAHLITTNSQKLVVNHPISRPILKLSASLDCFQKKVLKMFFFCIKRLAQQTIWKLVQK
jgi:hypothetical protein